jgi:small subunit ribosomal protein S6
VYVFLRYVGKGGLVSELERNLKLQDSVLKYQTVLTRENVDVAALAAVDPEEIKFQRLELPPEEEERESRERALGLLDLAPDNRDRREPRPEREDDFEDEPEKAKDEEGEA